MTLDEILNLYAGAGMDPVYLDAVRIGYLAGQLTERKECAQLCENVPGRDSQDMANRIRARSQK